MYCCVCLKSNHTLNWKGILANHTCLQSSNPCLSSPCSCSKREKTFSGIPAPFYPIRTENSIKGRSCLLVNAQRAGSPCCLVITSAHSCGDVDRGGDCWLQNRQEVSWALTAALKQTVKNLDSFGIAARVGNQTKGASIRWPGDGTQLWTIFLQEVRFGWFDACIKAESPHLVQVMRV